MAYQFETTGSRYAENTAIAVPARPFTLACWGMARSTAGGELVGFFDKSTHIYAYYLSIKATTYLGRAIIAESSYVYRVANSSVGTTINTWAHVCGVFQSSSPYATAYLNGGNSGTVTTDATPTGIDTLSFGVYWEDDVAYVRNVNVAEVGLWDVALTAAEIAALGKGFSPLQIRPENLLSYWPLARTNQDIVGGYNLTAVNSPTFVDQPPPIRRPSGIYVPSKTETAATPVGLLISSKLVNHSILQGRLVG